MVGVIVGKEATKVYIAGHGLAVTRNVELAPDVHLSPKVVRQEDSFGTTALEFQTMAAVLAVQRVASFSIVVKDQTGGQTLAAKGWNALWIFNLLSLTCRTPIIPLYSASNDRPPKFSNANRNIFIKPLPIVEATDDQLAWARNHYSAFVNLLSEGRFRSAQSYYNNSHYVLDHDARIMLLWAGIESLLDVDQELSRRIALHAALLLDGDSTEKVEHFRRVKRAYGIRSKVVHGSNSGKEGLGEAASFAGDILIGLLRKVVELGRVPSGAELDETAASASI